MDTLKYCTVLFFNNVTKKRFAFENIKWKLPKVWKVHFSHTYARRYTFQQLSEVYKVHLVWISWDSANVNNTLTVGPMRRKIRLIEGNAKCRHLKKLTCKGTLRLVFICLRPRNPYLPPLQTVYLYLLYSILIYTGKGGGESWNQKRFIYRILARHGCLPVWLVAAWYSSGSGHGPTWTSRTEVGVLKKLSLAVIAKLSRLKYRWLRFVWPEPTIGWCTQPANSYLILQSSMKYLGLAGLA